LAGVFLNGVVKTALVLAVADWMPPPRGFNRTIILGWRIGIGGGSSWHNVLIIIFGFVGDAKNLFLLLIDGPVTQCWCMMMCGWVAVGFGMVSGLVEVE